MRKSGLGREIESITDYIGLSEYDHASHQELPGVHRNHTCMQIICQIFRLRWQLTAKHMVSTEATVISI